MRKTLRFYLGSSLKELSDCPPTLSLLDWLRLDERTRGTKEGCNEGDCGACTVVVGRLEGERLVYRAVNACILFLPTLDGCQIYTVEHLKSPAGLHPVQQALVDYHGSQCGFCTPGIVMSLFALWLNEENPDTDRINDALAGNLCRCTGYRPIVDAALGLYRTHARKDDPFIIENGEVTRRLTALQDQQILHLSSQDGDFYAPAGVQDLAKLYLANPKATLVAGMTDVGLWVTKGMMKLDPVISLGRLSHLKRVEDSATEVTFGAMVSLTTVHRVLGEFHPQISELLRRFGSEQVRNSGTIGGNIANGSPIGDLPPLLIALGARLTLCVGDMTRTIPLESYFIAYKKQDRVAGEFVESITVPKLTENVLFHVSKVSKRFDEDISALCAALWLHLENGKVSAARLAIGGMAATPKRAAQAELALLGKDWSFDTAEAAAAALGQDFAPLSDWRATSNYRAKVAGNILKRFATETLTPHVSSRVTAVGGRP